MIAFTASRATLARHLRTAMAIADRKSTMPQLACAVLTVADKRLTIAATDMTVAVLASMPITAGKDGAWMVDAKALHDVVAGLPGDELTVVGLDNHHAEIKAGKVRYKLAGQNAQDAVKPLVPPSVWSPADGVALAASIGLILPAVCHDETRFQLNGILFERSGGGVALVATDGHRLHTTAHAAIESMPAKQIVPSRGAVEIRKAIADSPEIGIMFGDAHVFVRVDDGNVWISAKLTDAQFPPWQQVIPRPAHIATFAADELAAAVARCKGMVTGARGAAIAFENGSDVVTIRAEEADRGDVSESIDLLVPWTGPTVVIGFNPPYLAEAIAAVGGPSVRVGLGGELDPILVCNDGPTRAVVMPMRVTP
jgi:DNA polymerase-3 subunit beta